MSVVTAKLGWGQIADWKTRGHLRSKRSGLATGGRATAGGTRQVPEGPAGPAESRGLRHAAGLAAAYAGTAPGRGRAAGRGRRHLVHLAGAGPPDQRQRAGPGRGGAHAPPRPGRARAPVPAGRGDAAAHRVRAAGGTRHHPGDRALARTDAGQPDQQPVRRPDVQPRVRGTVLGVAHDALHPPEHLVVLRHRAERARQVRRVRQRRSATWWPGCAPRTVGTSATRTGKRTSAAWPA